MICYAILLLHATRKRKVVCRKGWNLCSFLTKLLLLVGIDKSLQSGLSRMVGWNVAASYSTIGKLYLMKHSTVYWRYPKLIFLWKILIKSIICFANFSSNSDCCEHYILWSKLLPKCRNLKQTYKCPNADNSSLFEPAGSWWQYSVAIPAVEPRQGGRAQTMHQSFPHHTETAFSGQRN